MFNYQLKPVEETDSDRLLAWRNSERVRVMMFTDKIITPEEHRAWFKRVEIAGNPLYRIFYLEGQPAGLMSYTVQDKPGRRYAWGFYLGEAGVPKGSGSILGFAGLEYGFEKLAVRKLCGEVLARNYPSIGLHKKLGFRQEGHFKAQVLKGKTYEDVYSFAIFRRDWLENKARLQKLISQGKPDQP